MALSKIVLILVGVLGVVALLLMSAMLCLGVKTYLHLKNKNKKNQ